MSSLETARADNGRFVENGSLGQTLKAFGNFNERLVSSYVAKILEGLHYLHSEGVSSSFELLI